MTSQEPAVTCISLHLLSCVKLHLNLGELTGAFADGLWLFKGLSYFVVQLLTSGQQVENQAQLEAKGQHAQHHYGVVNC